MLDAQRVRRRDRDIVSREELDSILHAARVLRLAMALDNEAYLVPLSFGYDGRSLYFHSARHGLKLDMLRRNPRVCFEVEEEPRLVTNAQRACDWTFAYASVVGRGRAVELVQDDERLHALDEIMRHYGGDKFWHYESGVLARTSVWAVEIDSLGGKRSPLKEHGTGDE